MQAAQKLDLGARLQAAADQQAATQLALAAAETAKQDLVQRLAQHQQASQRLQRELLDERQATLDGRLADQQQKTDMAEKLTQMRLTVEHLQSDRSAQNQHYVESYYLLQADLSHQQDLVRTLQQQLINQNVAYGAEILVNAEQQRSDAQQLQQQIKDANTRATAAWARCDKAVTAMRSAERAAEEAVQSRQSCEEALKEAVKGRREAENAKQSAVTAMEVAGDAKENADSSRAQAEAARQEVQNQLRALQGRHSAELRSKSQLQSQMNKLSNQLAVATAEATSSNNAVNRAAAELESSQSEVALIQRQLGGVIQQHQQLEREQQAALQEMQRLRSANGQLKYALKKH